MRYEYDPTSGGYKLRAEQEAVRKGAVLLDRILPGWYNQISLDDLDMADGSMCMMGQLFGTEVEGKLAEEMYQDEIQEAREKLVDIYMYDESIPGYALALVDFAGKPVVEQIMAKLGITAEMAKEYQALQHVCNGHDNRCLWADEIATRKAQDEVKDGKATKAKVEAPASTAAKTTKRTASR